jgi:hypothetical protein
MTTLDTVLLFRSPQPKSSLEILKSIIRKQAYNDILDKKEKRIFLQILKSKKSKNLGL